MNIVAVQYPTRPWFPARRKEIVSTIRRAIIDDELPPTLSELAQAFEVNELAMRAEIEALERAGEIKKNLIA